MVKVKYDERYLEKIYGNNIFNGRTVVAKQFQSLGLSRATAYRKVNLIEKGSLKRNKIPGCPVKIATKKNIERIKTYFNNKTGHSQRCMARKLNCNQSTVSRIISKHTNITCFKKVKRPKRTAAQLTQMRPKCRKIYENYKHLDFVLDDESYFTLSNTTLAGNDIFYSDNVSQCPDNIKYYYKSKFEQKLLVWVAISSKGISKLYFVPSKQAINQHIYLNECIKKRLLPFLNEYYKHNQGYVFWPDLASAHYAANVTDFMKEKNILFVPKSINPANTPEARPIEDFWSQFKRAVYAGGWQAENLDQLKKRIIYCYNKMDQSVFQALAQDTKKRLYNISKFGIS